MNLVHIISITIPITIVDVDDLLIIIQCHLLLTLIMLMDIFHIIILIIRRPLWGKRRCEIVALDLRSSVSGLELQL